MVKENLTVTTCQFLHTTLMKKSHNYAAFRTALKKNREDA